MVRGELEERNKICYLFPNIECPLLPFASGGQGTFL